MNHSLKCCMPIHGRCRVTGHRLTDNFGGPPVETRTLMAEQPTRALAIAVRELAGRRQARRSP